MSYWVGELAEFSWDVEVNDVDVEPGSFLVVITKPDGTTASVTPTNPTPGHFDGAFQIPTPGHFTWVAHSTDPVVAVAAGAFDAFDPNPQSAPVTGLAAPWIDAAALARRPEIIAYNAAQADASEPEMPPYVLDAAARFASEILYGLSGRQFAGLARTYCRPVARPEGWDARSWGASTLASYWSSWGSGYSMGYGAASALAVGNHLGQNYPPEVALNYPIQRIEQVKIDGLVIPSDEYRVDDRRLLVRTRPTADTPPTARWGWPHWQALWLPDTELSTFSITYWYGVGPPQSGIIACEVFATEVALDMVGAESRLPARIREISRQGETVAVLDSLEALQKGWTGIPIADYFIANINPYRLARRGSVWTPDMGRVRTPTPGT